MFELLKKAMQEHDIKPYSLARKANITPSDLYSALKGDRPMFPNWRKRISEALGVPEEDLFESEENDEQTKS